MAIVVVGAQDGSDCFSCSYPSASIFQNDVQGMDDTRNVTQDRQQNVDQDISTTSSLQEDTDGWEDDGEDDLNDVACGERHDGRFNTSRAVILNAIFEERKQECSFA